MKIGIRSLIFQIIIGGVFLTSYGLASAEDLIETADSFGDVSTPMSNDNELYTPEGDPAVDCIQNGQDFRIAAPDSGGVAGTVSFEASELPPCNDSP